jgi:integrase
MAGHTDIQAIYNWAIKNRRRTGCPVGFVNPLTGRDKLKEKMRRVQLSDDKIDEMLTLAKASTYPRMYGLMLMAITSGGRKNEIRRMRWSNTYWATKTAGWYRPGMVRWKRRTSTMRYWPPVVVLGD